MNDQTVGETGLWVTFDGMDALALCERLNITRKTNKHVALSRVLAEVAEHVARIKQLEIGHDTWRAHAKRADSCIKELEAELAQEKEATVFCPDCRRVVKRTRRLSVHHALQARVKKLEALLEGGQHQGCYNLSRQLGDDVRDALAGEEESRRGAR